MDRQAVHQDFERARASFHELHAQATAADLKRRSHGTRWNNQQLLFHMLLGYLIIRLSGTSSPRASREVVGARVPGGPRYN
jgi:hypothetical protein